MSFSVRSRRLAGPALLLAAAFLAIVPQLVRGNSCGHDFDFHLVSWLDALQSWRQGILYPHWAASPNYGAGEPRFLFYPPFSWMLGAAFGAILPWRLVPIALTWIFLAGAGLATRALARKFLPEGAATLAGCLALFSGYALYTAYERSDFAELSGGFWIPLLLFFIFHERDASAPLLRRTLDGSTWLLALTLAGAWFSNAPLGVMASYLLVFVALVLAAVDRSWAPLLRTTVASIVGLGLTAFFLVPAATEQGWADMRQILDDPGTMIRNSWIFARHASSALVQHDAELLKVSLLGAVMLALAAVGIAVCRMRRALPGPRRYWLSLALIPAAVLFLQLPLSAFLWDLLPKLRFLQFPWRWYVVLSAPMAILFAAAIWPERTRNRILVASACTLFFLATTLVAARSFFQVCYTEDSVWARLDAFRAGDGFEGADEYEPPFADASVLATSLPPTCLASDPLVLLGRINDDDVLQWTPEEHTCLATFAFAPQPGLPAAEHVRVLATASQPAWLILRLRSYPAWLIRINSHPVHWLPERSDGLIAVPIPAGSSTVTADWTITADVRLGRWLSVLALLLLTVLCVVERRLAASRLS